MYVYQVDIPEEFTGKTYVGSNRAERRREEEDELN